MDLQVLFVELFNKNIDDPGIKPLLEDLVKKYPYFAAPHFFLLKKTAPTDNNYSRLAARAALHFDNPYLINYRLTDTDRMLDVKEDEWREKINDREAPNQTEEIAKIEEPVESEVEMVEDVHVDTEVENILANSEILKAEAVTPEVELAEPIPGNVNTGEKEMLFEPLFATDYFASQGIKLSDEVQAGDKLGKQLKSFTEWLKSMKKVHDGKPAGETEQIDLAVQNLAEKSNKEDDILTESMAEAYLLQGKNRKAKEIFGKLSLLNPAKSAYFAAKIEQIG